MVLEVAGGIEKEGEEESIRKTAFYLILILHAFFYLRLLVSHFLALYNTQ